MKMKMAAFEIKPVRLYIILGTIVKETIKMHAHIIVMGHVQGVGFRYTTQQYANQYNLNGWVQNKSDGTVELEVEGNDGHVHSFLNELEKGFSPFIRVQDMQVNTQHEEKGYKAFMIK